MIRATEELRKLGDILDACSSGEEDNRASDSGAMHLRRKIQVQQEVVDSFERELIYVNRAIWDYPQSAPERKKSGQAYDEDIRAVLRRDRDPQRRLRTFQRMLMTLQRRPPSEAGSSSSEMEARKERLRQLRLVVQDVIFDPAALESLQQKDKDEEAISNLTPLGKRGPSSRSPASQRHGNDGSDMSDSRPPVGTSSRARRAVIKMRPL